MAKFDSLLQQIHIGSTAGPIVTEENEYITITKDRKFVLPKDFNTVIAYEGDINSQIITFECPIVSEGHDLSKCQEKRVRWKNMASGHEGSTKLKATELENTMLLSWEVPAEAFTKSGNLTVSISIFDYLDGRVAFSWNTPTFTELRIGDTLDSVGYHIGQEREDYLPPKNEILLINNETRKITAPTGYNNVFCNYGDVNTSVVFFQVKRYIRGIDLLDEGTIVNIYWKMKDLSNVDSSAADTGSQERFLYTVELDDRDGEGLVNIVWRPSRRITENVVGYYGPITIQIELISTDGKVWRSGTYNELTIGQSEFSIGVSDLPGDDSNINGYIIDGAVTLTDKTVNTVAGVVKLRSYTENSPIFINKNELAIETDANGNYVGVKIGTVSMQDARTAPYVALAPETTILLHGGDANE